MHGKHVLCEKPFVLKRGQAEELFNMAKDKHLILFEGIKTAYCPGFTKLIAVACSGLIGCIKYVDACFTKLESEDSRELTDTKYGGSFLELGSYCMLPVLKLLGTEYEEVTFDSIHDKKHIDIFTKASFKFHKGLATVTCGLGVKSEGRLLIAGTKGYITVEAPWWKTTYFEVHFEDESKTEKYSERFLGDGLRYEISDLLNQINGNEKSEFKLTREESIAMAGVIQQFMEHEGR
jgi:predicted dehydrogenase